MSTDYGEEEDSIWDYAVIRKLRFSIYFGSALLAFLFGSPFLSICGYIILSGAIVAIVEGILQAQTCIYFCSTCREDDENFSENSSTLSTVLAGINWAIYQRWWKFQYKQYLIIAPIAALAARVEIGNKQEDAIGVHWFILPILINIVVVFLAAELLLRTRHARRSQAALESKSLLGKRIDASSDPEAITAALRTSFNLCRLREKNVFGVLYISHTLLIFIVMATRFIFYAMH